MAATHSIDHEKKIILTIWEGELQFDQLSAAFADYQKNLRSQNDYALFDELLIFRAGSNVRLNSSCLEKLGELTSNHDQEQSATALAIVVESLLHYGLARMYEAYRGFNGNSTKITRVFRDEQRASEWLEQRRATH